MAAGRVSHSSVEAAISVNKKATRSVTVSRMVNRSGSWLRMRSSRRSSSGEGSTPSSSRTVLPGALIGAQRLGLTAVPVEGHHQLGLEPLPQRILRRQSHQLPGHHLVAAQGEIGVDRVHRRVAQLLEAADLGLEALHPDQVGVGAAPPQPEPGPQRLRRRSGLAESEPTASSVSRSKATASTEPGSASNR